MTQPPQEPQDGGTSGHEPPATPNPYLQGADGWTASDHGSDGQGPGQTGPADQQHGPPSYEAPSYGAPTYGASSYGAQPQNGDQPYGGQQYGQTNGTHPYGDQASAGQPWGGQSYGDQPWGGQQHGAPSYGGQPYGAPAYGGSPYGSPSYGVQPYGYGAGGGLVASASEPGLDLPYYGIGPVAAFTRALKKYARFDGRASRSEYWWFQLGVAVLLLVLLIPLVLALVSTASSGSSSPSALLVFTALLTGLVYLALIVPSLALSVRRLHDTDQSGWLLLLNLIPSVGGIIVLVLMVLASNPRGARFDVLTSAGGYPGYPG